MTALARVRRAVWGIRHEWRWGWHHVRAGRLGYLYGVLAYRALALGPHQSRARRLHRLVTKDGATIFYRRERGDLQGIREIFNDEIYRLPDGAAPISLVDLGANIGLATVWLCATYGIRHATAVEPDAANVAILERNCAANEIPCDIRAAAVGPESGTARFQSGTSTNLGQLSTTGVATAVIGIGELLSSVEFEPSLLKMDIEGAESALLRMVNPSWVTAFEYVVGELHPEADSIEELVGVISSLGFTYFPPLEHHVGVIRQKRERLFVKSPTTLSR
jgi:FkbM family methyltransferase